MNETSRWVLKTLSERQIVYTKGDPEFPEAIKIEKLKIAGNRLDRCLKGIIKTDKEITNMLCSEISYDYLLATVKEYKHKNSDCCIIEQLDLCVDNPLTLLAITDQLQKALEIEKVLFVSKNYYLEYYVNRDQNLCILLYI